MRWIWQNIFDRVSHHRRAMISTAIGCVTTLCAPFISATPLSAETAFHDDLASWAKDEDMLPMTFAAIARDGAIVAKGGSGAPPQTPLPIASISKTIAGQCILEMVDQGILRFEDTLGQSLGWSGAHKDVTIKNLITNASGFGGSLIEGQSIDGSTMDQAKWEMLIAAISKNDVSAERGTFDYNNDNWIVLEQVARTKLGRDPISWCRQNVPILRTLKTLARSAELGPLGFAGGLQISALDLAEMFRNLDPQPHWPAIHVSGKNQYGPGLFISQTDNGQILYHTGTYCPPNGTSIGAMAVQLSNGTGVAILYTGCAEVSDLTTLNQLIDQYLAD